MKKESNLSQEGNCWLYDNARSYGTAKVLDNAKIYGEMGVYDCIFKNNELLSLNK